MRESDRSRIAPLASRALSVVVQGPVVHGDSPTDTPAVLASLRSAFPDAELILSTWAGTDTDGLDVDAAVRSDDPGVGERGSNVNRQIVSSRAGIARATRPYVLKTRTDILFFSGQILERWGRFVGRAPFGAMFQERLLVGSVFTRRPSLLAPYPFHPGDWVFLGRRDDVQKLFSVPLQRSVAPSVPLSDRMHEALLQIHGGAAHLAIPEQYLWTAAMQTAGHDAPLRYWCDLTPETLVRSEVALVQNTVVLDAVADWDLMLPKYPTSGRLMADASLLDHAEWRELYSTYVDSKLSGIGESFVEARWRRMLEYVVAEAPAFARDESGGGGALRHQWPLLTELANSLLGRVQPQEWRTPRRAGPLVSTRPQLRAGASLRVPSVTDVAETFDVVAPAGLAYAIPDVVSVASRFSAGIPVHEQRLHQLQSLADQIGDDGVAIVGFPIGDPTVGDRYWRNDVRRWHAGTTDETPLPNLAPLRTDTRAVGLLIDDFVVTTEDTEQRLWATLRRYRNPARPRRALFDARVAQRLGDGFGAAPFGWSCVVRDVSEPQLAGRLDAMAFHAEARMDAIVIDARALIGDPPLLEDNEAYLFIDVIDDWACVERALRVAWIRPRTALLVPHVALRDTIRRMAPGVSCYVMRSRALSPRPTNTCDVRWCSAEWRDHEYEPVVRDVVTELSHAGRTVADTAAHDIHARVALLGPHSHRAGTPSRWLCEQSVRRGGSMPLLGTNDLPASLYSALATADVVFARASLTEPRGDEHDALVTILPTSGAEDLLGGVHSWLDDNAARIAHVRYAVTPVLQRVAPLWPLILLECET